MSWINPWDNGAFPPRYYQPYPHYVSSGSTTKPPSAPAMSEEDVRRIVREEMADLVDPDVPGAPPEDWS